MRVASTLLMLGLLSCTKAGTTSEPIGNSPPGAKPPPAAAALDVQITSVTLGDDCGAAAAPAMPSMPPPSAEEAKRASDSEAEADMMEYARACDQTSMQLAVTGGTSGAPSKITIKKVELYDDKGTLIGELVARNPTVWSQNGTYGAWDQTVAPKQALSVSYHLSAPNWSKVGNRWDRSYTLKAVLTVGSSDRSVKREVHLASPASLPADVET